jgi:hypothetical protein
MQVETLATERRLQHLLKTTSMFLRTSGLENNEASVDSVETAGCGMGSTTRGAIYA